MKSNSCGTFRVTSWMMGPKSRLRSSAARMRRRNRMLSRSVSTTSHMPGYWTLTATVRPSLSMALWTWARDAAAVRVGDEVGTRADYLAELDEKSLLTDGEVVDLVGRPGVVGAAPGGGLLVAQVEAPLADRGRLVAQVDAAGPHGAGG